MLLPSGSGHDACRVIRVIGPGQPRWPFANLSRRVMNVTEPLKPNATMTKFGYPDSLVKAHGHWVVLLRPQQVTLGALVLVCREPVTAFAALSAAAFAELKPAVTEIEATLSALWTYQKINYLMLMMVDPDVHFHVLPRYDGERRFADLSLRDAGWPGPPDLGAAATLPPELRTRLVRHLRENWRHGG